MKGLTGTVNLENLIGVISFCQRISFLCDRQFKVIQLLIKFDTRKSLLSDSLKPFSKQMNPFIPLRWKKV